MQTELAFAIDAPMGTSKRERHLAYLDRLEAETDKTLNEIAELAHVSPSNLYKFRRDETKKKLADRTLSRLSAWSGITAPDLGETPGLADIAAEFTMEGMARLSSDMKKIGNGEEQATRVSDNGMNLEGIEAGDIVVYDDKRIPRPGNIVVAQVYDVARGTARTVVRQYNPPYLLAATTDTSLRQPLLIDEGSVRVIGVAKRQLRDRDLLKVS